MRRFNPSQRRFLLGALFTALALILAACQPANSSPMFNDEDILVVTVSVLPQAYFVERIGGEHVEVNVMVGPGEDAHTYEPKPDQMRALSQSALFFSIGVEYEDVWLPRFADNNPEMDIIDSGEGIPRLTESHPPSQEGEEGHDDEVRRDHTNDSDPHIWLSPNNGKIIARNIYTALATASPEDEAAFTTNYEALIADIEALDGRIRETLDGIDQRQFMVYHPAWGYFAAEYNLTQLPVQTGGTDPSPSELAALIDHALEENIRVIFVQPSFSAANARAIAEEINGEVAMVDPLARDWLENLERAADAFASALGQ